MTKKELARICIDRLKKEYPRSECTLDYDHAWQLLVSVRLAAQCTDARVNVVVQDLFARYPSVEALAAAEPEEIEAIVKPCGLGRSKARDISACMRKLRDEYGGKVPQAMEDLLRLPGVGRKTANVVLGNAFGVPGFPVDTHVIRVTGRLRWRSDWASPSPDPVAIEREVTACFPPEEWTDLSHRLILHGRAICHARKPDCADCPLNDTCPGAFAA